MHLKAGLQRLLPVFVARQRGERRGGDRANSPRIHGAESADQGVPVFVGHGNISEQHIHPLALHHFNGLCGRRGRQHHGVAALEVRRHYVTAAIVIVDHQDGNTGEQRGR